MNHSGSIIDNIARFTSHRDSELLAFSLLKSINGMLSPIEASIIKLDSSDKPVLEMKVRGQQCFIEDRVELKERMLNSIDYMNNLSLQDYTLQDDESCTYFHLLQHSRKESDFLCVKLEEQLHREQIYILSGILSIYTNYVSLLIDSQTDQLTGLPNRKTFDEHIVKIFSAQNDLEIERSIESERRSNTSQKSYWLAIIDVDHFKKINDTFGHLYGDEVLIVLGQKLKTNFRQSDLKFRFGGEEFVVILESNDMEGCKNKLNEFREVIANTAFPNKDQVTVSIGAVQLQEDIFHVTLMDYADQALYHSKKNGRNKVTFFEDMLETGDASLTKIKMGAIDLF